MLLFICAPYVRLFSSSTHRAYLCAIYEETKRWKHEKTWTSWDQVDSFHVFLLVSNFFFSFVHRLRIERRNSVLKNFRWEWSTTSLLASGKALFTAFEWFKRTHIFSHSIVRSFSLWIHKHSAVFTICLLIHHTQKGFMFDIPKKKKPSADRTLEHENVDWRGNNT